MERITLENARKKREERTKLNTEKICDFIDEFIEINVETLCKYPMVCKLPEPYCDGNVDYYFDTKYIENRYKDFTVQPMGSIWHTSVRIKLAEKDWDWNGYGIKPAPYLPPPPPPKKSWFKRLFN